MPCEYCWAAVRSHLHGWMHLGVANARSHTCHFPDICSNYSKFLFVHDGNRFATNIKLLYCNWNRYDNGLYLSSFSLCLLLHFALLFHFGASTTPSRGPWFMAVACCCTWAERSSSGSLGWWTHLSCTCLARQLLWTSPFLTSLCTCRTAVSRRAPISSATRHCHFWAWKHEGRLAATSKICGASQLQWGVTCSRATRSKQTQPQTARTETQGKTYQEYWILYPVFGLCQEAAADETGRESGPWQKDEVFTHLCSFMCSNMLRALLHIFPIFFAIFLSSWRNKVQWRDWMQAVMVDSWDQKCRHCTSTPPQADSRGTTRRWANNTRQLLCVWAFRGIAIVITVYESWQYSGHDVPRQIKDDRLR